MSPEAPTAEHGAFHPPKASRQDMSSLSKLLRTISGLARPGRDRGAAALGARSLSEANRLVASGVADSKAGRVGQAEASYRKALELDAGHSEASYLLGVVLQQRGDVAGAIECVERSINVDGRDAKKYKTLGSLYLAVNRLETAEKALRDGIRLDPSDDTAWNLLGIVLRQRGNVEEAQGSFETAVQRNPSNPDAHTNLGNVWLERGELHRAEACYRAALTLQPSLLPARMNLGATLRRQGRSEDAAECYREVLALDSNNGPALSELGLIHMAAGRLAEAEECLSRAINAAPRLLPAWCNLADCFLALGKREQAEQTCEKALEIQPKSADALSAFARALVPVDPERAERFCREAIAIAPDHGGALNTLGTILRARGKVEGAEATFRRALSVDPEAIAAKYNLAIACLRKGDYRQGFELYESRFQAFGERMVAARRFEQTLGTERRWHGQSVAGTRILVWTEQGFGDAIMTLRYLPLLKLRGTRELLVVCQPELARLIGGIPTVDRVVTTGDDLSRDEFDLHCPAMSLPREFGTRHDSIPCDVPYVGIPADLAKAWRERFAGATGVKVGIAWAGSELLEAHARRSLPLSKLAPLLAVQNVSFISLQKALPAGDTEDREQIIDRMAECGDFMDTAALIANLDLVISVDTAVVHLAGALGRPVWLLNRFDGDWRWGLGLDRSPWYPTMTIFNQTAPDRWEDVIERVATDLHRFVLSTAP